MYIDVGENEGEGEGVGVGEGEGEGAGSFAFVTEGFVFLAPGEASRESSSTAGGWVNERSTFVSSNREPAQR